MQPQVDLRPGQTIVLIDGSITDAGRRELAYKPFGYGYVYFVTNMLFGKVPPPRFNLLIINAGLHGNTVRSLKARRQKDCIAHRLDILSVLIGVNDVWR